MRARLGTKFATVGAKSTATYSATGPAGCVIALNASEPVGIELAGSSVLSAPKCLVQSNATSTTSMTFASSTTLTATAT